MPIPNRWIQFDIYRFPHLYTEKDVLIRLRNSHVFVGRVVCKNYIYIWKPNFGRLQGRVENIKEWRELPRKPKLNLSVLS